VRELTTIFALGKAVTSITDQRTLLDKILEGAVYVTEADSGWLLLREDRGKAFLLGACRNLPKSIAEKLNQPWEDGISSLVALSGESLSISGEPIKRFKVASLGQAALVVPVKARKEVVGLLAGSAESASSICPSCQALLEAVANYASIRWSMLVCSGRWERARSLQQSADGALIGERVMDEIMQSASHEMQALLESPWAVDLLLGEQRRNLSGEQTKALRIAQENMKYLKDVVDTAAGIRQAETPRQKTSIDVNDLARRAVTHFQRVAHQNGVACLPSFPLPDFNRCQPLQILNVFEHAIECGEIQQPGRRCLCACSVKRWVCLCTHFH
jgi:hypothetical protein